MKKRVAISIVGSFALTVSAGNAETTCSSVAACIFGSNTASGIGVEGSSKSGSGVSGVSTSGYGVSGVSSSSHGVNGSSSTSFGVVGITTAKGVSAGTARAGVLGEDTSTTPNSLNSGVSGTSKNGYGVYGSGGTYGGYFENGLYTYSSASAIQLSALTGSAISAYAQSGNVALLFDEDAGADLIEGANKEDVVVSIDASGSEILRGTLTTNGTPQSRTRSSVGPDVVAFSAEVAAPSIEDVGKAQLRNGAAYVALDRTFASTIDPHVAYSVFITPEGDSNGLYTAQLGPSGFAVHENKGGRSSIVFDYRIVAKPLGSKTMHLPPISQFRQLPDHAPVPAIRFKRP